MLVLGIDTSAVCCSVGLISEEKVLASVSFCDGLTHSQTLLPGIRRVLEDANCSLNDLSAVAISAGPGSFTGLRIGISTVKGLTVSTGIPCAAISTLEALAENARELSGKTVVALMDARRGEFYTATFQVRDGSVFRVTQDQALSGDKIIKQISLEDEYLLLGDGALKFTQLYPQCEKFLAPESIRMQSGLSVAKLGITAIKEKRLIPSESLAPNYLRLPQAEREWLEKNSNK